MAVLLVCALAGCRPSKPMTLCKRAEAAGVLKDCWEFEGNRGRATNMVVANDVKVGRVFIAAYASRAAYEDDLRDKEVAHPGCLHGNPKKGTLVFADRGASEDICRAVYDIVDADE